MGTVNYVWDPIEDNVVLEVDDTGVPLVSYTAEPSRFGNVISQCRSGQCSFFHYDGLGSILAVTDDSQNITDTRAYSAFGETTGTSGNTSLSFQYIGQNGYLRGNGDTYSVRRRVLSTTAGRWLTLDPTGLVDGPNRYIYVTNSPTMLIDPSGLQWLVNFYDVRPSNCKSTLYHVQHDFAILPKNIPKPTPKQVWVANKQTTFVLTRNCELQPIESTVVDPFTFKVEKRLVSYVFDAWPIEGSLKADWETPYHVFEDTFQNIIEGPSNQCLFIVRNEKIIGFNGLLGGEDYLLADGLNYPNEVQFEKLVKGMRGPLGYLDETYYQFHKDKCPQCLRDCFFAWAWSLVPECITCFVFSDTLTKFDPNANTTSPISPHLCGPVPKGTIGAVLPSVPPMR